ncbi:MAG TPA: formate--tetrahydrofolate ligase [Dehalococcoidia bacterium]|nr:formate--tetrahydrofolate ligase [Dehalococcoidia bacterium]
MRPIAEIVSEMGLDRDSVEPHGREIVKVPLESFPQGSGGKLIVVTAITPTPAGEGKTTTSIGLTDGLAKIGKHPVLTIREPSLGPLFGRKGGGTGGGNATVHPSNDINLHFTGDFHAIQSAHNFLAAMTDNAARLAQIEGFTPDSITWRRVTDAQDRALRQVVTGVGGRIDGPLRETGFDTSAASEIMAILALANDYIDLRQRLSDIVVGWRSRTEPVTAGDINCVGAMMVLLKDSLKPNLVQTVGGQPTVIHAGPFGNIAHGCSSIIADRLALASGDYVITEAGFGADLGFEKFMDIKVRQGGAEPSAVVVVATVRGMKWHGGVKEDALTEANLEAVETGVSNLRHALAIVARYGLPAVVAINRFPDDTPEEVAEVQRAALEAGAQAAVEAKGFELGGEGMVELAEAVVAAADQPSKVTLLYEDDDPTIEKVETLATDIYQAGQVIWGPMTRTTSRRFENNGWHFPLCVAKTHLSVSADPTLRGAPTDHKFTVNAIRVAAGARQVIVLAGSIVTLPGLPASPNALDIDLTEGEQVVGLF